MFNLIASAKHTRTMAWDGLKTCHPSLEYGRKRRSVLLAEVCFAATPDLLGMRCTGSLTLGGGGVCVCVWWGPNSAYAG